MAQDGGVVELRSEVGFFGIEEFWYRYEGEDRRSWPVRLWYAFQPADEEPERKPIAVLFNGGPGAATTSGLLAMNTARHTVHPDFRQADIVGANPHSWTRFASLLYVDPRDAGFSYSLRDQEGEAPALSFVPEHDAGLVLRVVLRFLARHPQLRENPVVVVGKSYGGARASILLRQLLHREELGQDVGGYYDPLLMAEIDAHLAVTCGSTPGAASCSVDQVAAQFGAQILVQPWIAGEYQATSPSQLAPHPECCCDDSEYNIEECDLGRYDPFYSERDAAAEMVVPATLVAMVEAGALTVAWMHPSMRRDAVRRCAPTSVYGAPLTWALGELGPEDVYFCRQADVDGADATTALQDVGYGRWFLENAVSVRTLVTHAAFDTVVWGEAIPEALGRYDDVVSSVVYDAAPRDGVSRPGWLRLTYQPSIVGDGGRTYEMRFPFYDRAGHNLTGRQPGELLEDVVGWYLDAR